MTKELDKLKASFEARNDILEQIKEKIAEGIILVNDSSIPPNISAIFEVLFLTHTSHLDDRQTQSVITSAIVESLVRVDERLTAIFKELDSLAAPVSPDESDAPA